MTNAGLKQQDYAKGDTLLILEWLMRESQSFPRRQVSGLNAPHVVLAVQCLLAAARAYWNGVARTRALARIIVVVSRMLAVMVVMVIINAAPVSVSFHRG